MTDKKKQSGTISRKKIALETLGRYTGIPVKQIQKYILLTNFPYYVDQFANHFSVDISQGTVIRSAHVSKEEISIIDYRVGSPMAALIIDVLSYIEPECILMLGQCGGLHRYHKIGDFILPAAAIRDEGASQHYMPHQVPSLPAFMVQSFLSRELIDRKIEFKTGVVHTTDYRMWEFDESFIARLKKEKASAIDMECSALFTVGFCQKVPVGALMLISDLPTQLDGVKTQASAHAVFEKYTALHLELGIDSLRRMRDAMKTGGVNFRRYHF